MSHTDIKSNDWVTALPEVLRPYARLARLDRPIGTWLLLLPGWWAIIMAAGGIRYVDFNIIRILVLFGIGAVIMRGAGCVINDLWDIRFDQKVERTRIRPLASGELKPWQALAFLALLLLLGFCILMQFSLVTILLGFLSLPIIVIYPLAKRWTWWPQALLGIIFNFGALMGWGAVTDVLELPCLLLYAAGFFWTLAYDTIYAHQDKEDDMLIGVKSTALLFGDKSRKWVSAFFAVCLAFLVLSGIAADRSWMFYVLLLPAAYHAWWQAGGWKMDDPADSLKRFRSNRNFGLLVMLAMMA